MSTKEHIKIYLDHCTFKRPYDTPANMRIILETQAKLRIQEMIVNGKFILVISYLNVYENSQAIQTAPRMRVEAFMSKFAGMYVDDSYAGVAEEMTADFVKNGLKSKDATHLACAIIAGCKYLITTDDKFLRFGAKVQQITITDPATFIRLEENYE